MYTLRDVFEDQYKISDAVNAEDYVVINQNQVCLLNQYGVKVDGLKFKNDGTILTAVPRKDTITIYDEEAKVKKLSKLGYSMKDGENLSDFLHNILLAVVTECEFTGQKIDRVFIDIVRKVYPTISNILYIGYHRSDGGYDTKNQILYGMAYRSKDMFYKYPEFAKVVNSLSLLALVGSFDEYYKYATNRNFALRGLEKNHITIPYLDDMVLKIKDEPELPFDSFDWVWMDSGGRFTFDLTESNEKIIYDLVLLKGKVKQLPTNCRLIVPKQYKEDIELQRSRIDEANKALSWRDKIYYFRGNVKFV